MSGLQMITLRNTLCPLRLCVRKDTASAEWGLSNSQAKNVRFFLHKWKKNAIFATKVYVKHIHN